MHYRNYARLMRHWHAIAPGRPEIEGVTDILANKKVTTTASTLQVRQPIHTRNVGGWRRYAAGMAPVAGLLADLVAGYEAQGLRAAAQAAGS